MDDFYAFLITGEQKLLKSRLPMRFLFLNPFLVFWLIQRYKRVDGCEKLRFLQSVPHRFHAVTTNEVNTYWIARKIAGLTILWINLFRQGKALCLERAIIICYVLRSFDLPAKVIIAKKLSFSMIEQYPFHAWVELYGKAVDEHQAVQQQYKLLDSLPS
jgi:hypothetical protein